jgi:NAD(P)-dependent dehydrogenase (short-subunit alcohol dehydrogenase family)
MTLNPMDLTGHSILVSGASSGMGRETSILLSRLGATLVLVARRADALAETERLLEGSGHRSVPYDLTATDGIPAWMKALAAESGPLSGLVHSAGIQLTRPLRVLTQAHLDDVMRINLGAAVALVKGFRQKGVVSDKGRSVVLVASIMGLVGQPGIGAYAASKGALIALCRSLALELAPERIRLNCVCPGHVHTEMAQRLRETLTPEQFAAIEAMHPLGIGTALDVAYAVAFLLADTSRWITGTTLVVDGGYTAQ